MRGLSGFLLLLRSLGLHLAGVAGMGFCIVAALSADVLALSFAFPAVLMLAWLAGHWRLPRVSGPVRQSGPRPS